MSYLCSQRASREAAEEPTTCAHVPAGKEPAVRKNAFVIGERAATTPRERYVRLFRTRSRKTAGNGGTGSARLGTRRPLVTAL